MLDTATSPSDHPEEMRMDDISCPSPGQVTPVPSHSQVITEMAPVPPPPPVPLPPPPSPSSCPPPSPSFPSHPSQSSPSTASPSSQPHPSHPPTFVRGWTAGWERPAASPRGQINSGHPASLDRHLPSNPLRLKHLGVVVAPLSLLNLQPS